MLADENYLDRFAQRTLTYDTLYPGRQPRIVRTVSVPLRQILLLSAIPDRPVERADGYCDVRTPENILRCNRTQQTRRLQGQL